MQAPKSPEPKEKLPKSPGEILLAIALAGVVIFIAIATVQAALNSTSFSRKWNQEKKDLPPIERAN
jgi:hypothetical protein